MFCPAHYGLAAVLLHGNRLYSGPGPVYLRLDRWDCAAGLALADCSDQIVGRLDPFHLVRLDAGRLDHRIDRSDADLVLLVYLDHLDAVRLDRLDVGLGLVVRLDVDLDCTVRLDADLVDR